MNSYTALCGLVAQWLRMAGTMPDLRLPFQLHSIIVPWLVPNCLVTCKWVWTTCPELLL